MASISALAGIYAGAWLPVAAIGAGCAIAAKFAVQPVAGRSLEGMGRLWAAYMGVAGAVRSTLWQAKVLLGHEVPLPARAALTADR